MSPVDIRSAPPTATYSALFLHLPVDLRALAAERLAELVADGDLNPAGILVACESTRPEILLGGALVSLAPGWSATVWPPRVLPGRQDVEAALASATIATLHAHHIKQAQVLLDLESPPPDALIAVGFRYLTRLVFLERTLSESDRSEPSGGIDFTPYCSANPQVFADTLYQTYEGTLDCPELNDVRSAEEIVAGYRAAALDPPPWWLVSDQGTARGVLILTPRPMPREWDLSYVGLTPTVRGQGLASELIRFALARIVERGGTRVVLNADERNIPALKAYRRQGFRPYQEQLAYWWSSSRERQHDSFTNSTSCSS